MRSSHQRADHFKRMIEISRLREKFSLQPNHRVRSDHDVLGTRRSDRRPLASGIFHRQKIRSLPVMLGFFGS